LKKTSTSSERVGQVAIETLSKKGLWIISPT
jgi:hypothetical protein